MSSLIKSFTFDRNFFLATPEKSAKKAHEVIRNVRSGGRFHKTESNKISAFSSYIGLFSKSGDDYVLSSLADNFESLYNQSQVDAWRWLITRAFWLYKVPNGTQAKVNSDAKVSGVSFNFFHLIVQVLGHLQGLPGEQRFLYYDELCDVLNDDSSWELSSVEFFLKVRDSRDKMPKPDDKRGFLGELEEDFGLPRDNYNGVFNKGFDQTGLFEYYTSNRKSVGIALRADLDEVLQKRVRFIIDHPPEWDGTDWNSYLISQHEDLPLEVSRQNTEEVAIANTDPAEDLPFARNRIFYGAPGTGKSYLLNQDAKRFDSVVRVTFHADYSNAQFVGSYKPKAYYVSEENGVFESFTGPVVSVRRPVLDYKVVPGPFLSTVAQALGDQSTNYLLIIEEINRANAAAVFGEMFQLLDRNINGDSEYSVTLSVEISAWLKEKLGEKVEGLDKDLLNEHESQISIKLPRNLYIWSTMNSADQGVMPLDTAFKRRWNFKYIPLDESQDKVTWNVSLMGRIVPWNSLRISINKFLMPSSESRLRISEDKLIGPFFIKESECNDEGMKHVVLEKLLLYLHQDIVRHDPSVVFSKILYSQIHESYSGIMKAYDGKTKEDINALEVVFKNVFSVKLAEHLAADLVGEIITYPESDLRNENLLVESPANEV